MKSMALPKVYFSIRSYWLNWWVFFRLENWSKTILLCYEFN